MATVKDQTETPLSFLTGMARVLDLGNTLDEYDLPRENLARFLSDAELLALDREALREDFRAVYARVLTKVDGETA